MSVKIYKEDAIVTDNSNRTAIVSREDAEVIAKHYDLDHTVDVDLTRIALIIVMVVVTMFTVTMILI